MSDRQDSYNSELRSVVTDYLNHLRRSINVGPLTKQPTEEARLLRRMQDLIHAPDPQVSRERNNG